MPQPLKYHSALRDLLRQMAPHVWQWFGRQRLEPAATEVLKFDLLKSTYRLTRESHPSLYAAVHSVADSLGLSDPITLYQSQSDSGPNAGLVFACDEIHIVLQGQIESRLNETELRALFGHEIGHHLFLKAENAEYLQAWDMLRAVCLETHSHPAFQRTFRKLSLYTEVFCDRTALEVTGDFDSVISMLVKVTLGATVVQPSDFLKQAHEISKGRKSDVSSEGITHPEPYIRACALEQFHKQAPDLESQLARWIEGPIDLAELDLLQQRDVSLATRQLIRQVLRTTNNPTDLLLSHARLYFGDFSRDECGSRLENDKLKLLLGDTRAESLVNYCCYVLLDFATADREIEELALASSLYVAEAWNLKSNFIPLVRKEMKLRKNQIEEWDLTKLQILKATNPMLQPNP